MLALRFYWGVLWTYLDLIFISLHAIEIDLINLKT